MALEREIRTRPGVEQEKRNIATETPHPTSSGHWVWEWTRTTVIAFGLFLLIRTFLIEAFRIPTASMENTLVVGDFLFVDKAVYGSRIPFTSARLPAFGSPARGDIVVFTPPHQPGKNYVKRLVALPGDTVHMLHKVLFVNGERQLEPYVRITDPDDTHSPQMHWQCEHTPRPASAPCRPRRDSWGPLVLPPDQFMMLGDNRDDSEDSRYWGFVPRAAIRGRPLFIYYSFDVGSGRPLPWLMSIRWSRIGDTVH